MIKGQKNKETKQKENERKGIKEEKALKGMKFGKVCYVRQEQKDEAKKNNPVGSNNK